jgi:hypothetical protein
MSWWDIYAGCAVAMGFTAFKAARPHGVEWLGLIGVSVLWPAMLVYILLPRR